MVERGIHIPQLDRLRFAVQFLHILPRQVQLFTPTPCTWSTLMYWTETDPFTGRACVVDKSEAGRERQKQTITGATGEKPPGRSATGKKKPKR